MYLIHECNYFKIVLFKYLIINNDNNNNNNNWHYITFTSPERFIGIANEMMDMHAVGVILLTLAWAAPLVKLELINM